LHRRATIAIMISREQRMAQLVVRNLEDEVKAKLRRRAAAHGWSMEEEVRAILRDAVKVEARQGRGLGTEIAALFRGIGLREGEEIHEFRGYTIKPMTFS
jgi:plasmid stability protein